MNDPRKQYVLSLSNLANRSIENIGQLAMNLEKIQQLGINTPTGFVITSAAFDDFLIANELLDYISPRINDLDYDNNSALKKTSEEIMHAIRTSVFPDILAEPILQAYSGLAGFYDAFVTLKKSPINDSLNEKTYAQMTTSINVAGKEALLERLKEYWSHLFTPEAIHYRGSVGYEGYLTEAIVVQKMLQSEVSGRVYSHEQINADQSLIEIQAFFGLNDFSLWKDMSPDSYYVSKKRDDIVEKKIVGQDWMLVRKGKSGDKNPIIKIPISKLWQKKQKLEDRFIVTLAHDAKLLEGAFQKPIEADWDYESGKVYITGFTILEEELPAEVNQQDVVVSEQMARTEEEKSGPSKSMEEYVEEIKKIREDLTTNSPLASNGKVVVDIKPFEELQMLAQGKSSGNNSAFGLVHFIFSETDYADLTGDEVLIVKDIMPEYLNILNDAKGLIIQNDVNEEDLLSITVPTVTNVTEAFDLFQENEVVTVRPWNGGVYLGAGKDENPDNIVQLDNAIAQTEITQTEIAPEYQDLYQQQQDQLNQIPQQEFAAKNEPQETEVEEPQPGIDLSVHNLPNTATDFWLAYHPGLILEGVSLLDGLVVRVADIIEQYDKALFSTELNSKLVTILNKVEGKPVILVSAGRGKLIEEIVELELDAISNLRNKDSMRNLWYSFDNISEPSDLVRLKRVFTNKGFRRSATFKLFLTIHSPHSLIALKGLLANDVDGVILDVDLMFKDHSLTTSLDDGHIQEYICQKIDHINQSRALSFLLASETDVPVSVAKYFVKAGLHTMVLNEEEILKLKPVIAAAESVTKVEKKKKRGRKRKEIDFGF